MSSSLENNALEVFRLDIAISIFVEVVESLSYPLSLQTSQHLRELRVCKIMPPLLASAVQGCPFAVPVKWYAIRALIQRIKLLQVLVFDRTCALNIEQPKSNLVLRVWFRKQVLKSAPVEEIDLSRLPPIRDSKEDSILSAVDLMLYLHIISANYPSNS